MTETEYGKHQEPIMFKKSPKHQVRELGRRDLIKWSLFAGAALGLARWKVYEVLEDTVGTAVAADASCHPKIGRAHV